MSPPPATDSPPLGALAAAAPAPPAATVATLIGRRDLELGLRCLGSLADAVAEPIRFQIHEDGTLTDDDRARLQARLPVARFVGREEADERMAAHLRAHPASLALRARFILGLKLFDVPLLCESPDVIFSDSDIFFFRRCRDLFSWPTPETAALFMRDWQEAYSLRPWHVLRHRSFRLPSRLNSGLFKLRAGAYDLDLMEWLVARRYPIFEKTPWLEQTCWAFLAARLPARFWSEDQILTVARPGSLAGDPIAGHFTSTVRALLAPEVLSRADFARPPETVRTTPMAPLRASRLGLEQAGRLLRRRLRLQPV